MATITQMLERGVIAYLQDRFLGTGEPLHGVTLYEGHGTTEKTALPHVVVTATNPGGDLGYAGIYEVRVQMTVMGSIYRAEEADDDPATGHEARVEALMGIFGEGQVASVKAALNEAGTGLAVSGLEIETREDARDQRVMGTAVVMRWWAGAAPEV